MDVAYDQIQKEAYAADVDGQPTEDHSERLRTQPNALGNEFKEAYNVISASPWATRLGGFFGQVKKQSESYYEGARQELSVAGAEASRGLTGFLAKTQSISIGQTATDEVSSGEHDGSDPAAPPKDIVKEAENILSRFRSDAAARLKQIQKAEDAADEALERFGVNLKNFLRDAVSIAPPTQDNQQDILFQSKDSDGKRIVHATRFDAQLHVIHSSMPGFVKNPESPEFSTWKESFDVSKKTDAIAKDLETYDELRRAMDKLVPEQVSYIDFWTRYYFLRHVIETEEQKRRELLKGTQAVEEEVAWDDDEEDEDRSQTPNAAVPPPQIEAENIETPAATPTNISPPQNSLLKPAESRRSNEHSVADSDASYDIVSGAPSRGPSSPKEDKEAGVKKKDNPVAEQSDEEDWE